MKNQILTSHVTMRHIYVVILTKYVVNSTIPYIILYYNLLYDYGLLLKSLEPLYAHTCFMIFFNYPLMNHCSTYYTLLFLIDKVSMDWISCVLLEYNDLQNVIIRLQVTFISIKFFKKGKQNLGS